LFSGSGGERVELCFDFERHIGARLQHDAPDTKQMSAPLNKAIKTSPAVPVAQHQQDSSEPGNQTILAPAVFDAAPLAAWALLAADRAAVSKRDPTAEQDFSGHNTHAPVPGIDAGHIAGHILVHDRPPASQDVN
jgi:hypothetical protein